MGRERSGEYPGMPYVPSYVWGAARHKIKVFYYSVRSEYTAVVFKVDINSHFSIVCKRSLPLKYFNGHEASSQRHAAPS